MLGKLFGTGKISDKEIDAFIDAADSDRNGNIEKDELFRTYKKIYGGGA